MNLFKVPAVEGKLSATQVVSVIDCSGSMEPWWIWVAEFYNKLIKKSNDIITITFDTCAKKVEDNIIDKNINVHGGGGTAIPEAFRLMENLMKEIPKTKPITVLFVSDGADNSMDTLEQRLATLKGNAGHYLNFICLGITGSFPTMLSMKLRELYHRGDPSVPALYLIEHPSEKAFYNKFTEMSKCFLLKNLVDIIPAVRLYPWEEPSEEVYESSWVICEEPILLINDQKYEVKDEQITIDDLSDIFRGWSQQLRLISLFGEEKIKAYSTKTLSEMERVLEFFMKLHNFEINLPEHPTFYQKTRHLLSARHFDRIRWFINEVETLAKFENQAEIGEFDAAKKIGLGTITGKYQQKVIALQNNTPERYEIYKEEFLKAYANIFQESGKEILIKEKVNSKYKCTSDVFFEEDFTEGVKLTKNVYDLLENFPLCGLAIQVKRCKGAAINPFKIEIIEISNHLISLQDLLKVNHSLSIKDSAGNEHKYNAILPIFNKSDLKIAPLLRENFFSLLMTFNVQLEPDAFNRHSLYALLCKALIHTIQVNPIPKALLFDIFQTFEVVYSGSEMFGFENSFLENPCSFWQSGENDEHLLDNVIACIIRLRLKGLEAQRLESLLHFAIQVFLNENLIKSLRNQKKKVIDFVYPLRENIDSVSLDPVLLTEKFIYKRQIIKGLTEFLKETVILDTVPFKLKIGSMVKNIDVSKTNFNVFKSLADFVDARFPTNEELLSWVINIDLSYGISNTYPDFKLLSKSDLDSKALENIKLNPKGFLRRLAKLLETKAKKIYLDEFRKTHFDVIPLNKTEIYKECALRKIPFEEIDFNSSGLPKNVCLAPKCPHYLKNIGENLLKMHMGNWGDQVPHFFHKTVKENLPNIDPVESVINKYKCDLAKYKVDHDLFKNYTEKVKDKFIAIIDDLDIEIELTKKRIDMTNHKFRKEIREFRMGRVFRGNRFRRNFFKNWNNDDLDEPVTEDMYFNDQVEDWESKIDRAAIDPFKKNKYKLEKNMHIKGVKTKKKKKPTKPQIGK